MSEQAIPDLLGHAAWLRRLAQALVHDQDAAQDVVQGTLVAAWQHPPALDARHGGDRKRWVLALAPLVPRPRAALRLPRAPWLYALALTAAGVLGGGLLVAGRALHRDRRPPTVAARASVPPSARA